ncbi:MAG: RND family transporter [Firmicutes bacterium]|nr:RND family transporter [Bacillota bacterium]
MERLARFVTRFPRSIVAVTILVTLALGLAATRIQRRVDLEENLPKSEPRLAVFHEFRAEYGSGNSVVIVLSGRDLFQPKALATVDRLTKGLLDLPGIKSVTSLTNLTEFTGEGDILRSGPVISSLPRTTAEARALRERILSDPWYVGRLVAKDGRTTIIMVNLANAATLEEALHTLERVRSYVNRTKGDLTARFAGSLVMDEQIDRALGKDVGFLLPLVLLAIGIVLFLSFRTIRGVVLPLVTVGISIVWTLGIMALLHRPLSLVSNIVPVLLVGIGSAYGIHIVARFQEKIREGLGREEAVRSTVAGTGFGVWMAAITTVAGFASLALSKIRMIFDFGVFSALGVAVAFLVSITFIPSLLFLLPPPRLSRREPEKGAVAPSGRTILSRTLDLFARGVTGRPALVLLLAGLLTVVSLVGWARLTTTFEMADFLPPGSEHRQAEALVDKEFGGSAELEVLVEGDLADPEVLLGIKRLQEKMVKLGATRPLSIVDLLARVNRAFHGGDPAYEVLPDDPALLPQYLFLLTLTASPDELSQFMRFDQREACIAARISNMTSTAERTRLIAAIEKEAKAIFGRRARVRVTGMPVIELVMVDLIRQEQLQNIYSSLMTVFALVVLAFRSFAMGFGCLLPIALTIVYSFGLMGWIGVALNAATTTMASLATGMGVDYSIHYYRRYLEERRAGRGRREALLVTAATTGEAIVTNAASVAVGFAVLVFSGLPIFRSFGVLIALTMILTAFGALTVLPASIALGLGVRLEKRLLRTGPEPRAPGKGQGAEGVKGRRLSPSALPTYKKEE